MTNEQLIQELLRETNSQQESKYKKVIMCKDCKYSFKIESDIYSCLKYWSLCKETDYCSLAKPKE